MKTVTLKKLSLCECGFPALHEQIKVGTEYRIEPDQTNLSHWICGGCNRERSVVGVFAYSRQPSGTGEFLPNELFEPYNDEGGASPKRQSEYVQQIQAMSENAKRWRQEHPEENANVVFGVKVMLIMPISEAVGLKLVGTNPAGLELLKAMWPWDSESEPTVTMVRIALELP